MKAPLSRPLVNKGRSAETLRRRGQKDHLDRARVAPADAPPMTEADVVLPQGLSPKHTELCWGLVNRVLETGQAARSDSAALEIFLSLYIQYTEVCDVLNTEGIVIERETKMGAYTVLHPLVAERGRLFVQLRAMMGQFGLMPLSRKTLLRRSVEEAVRDEDEDDGWDEILN